MVALMKVRCMDSLVVVDIQGFASCLNDGFRLESYTSELREQIHNRHVTFHSDDINATVKCTQLWNSGRKLSVGHGSDGRTSIHPKLMI